MSLSSSVSFFATHSVPAHYLLLLFLLTPLTLLLTLPLLLADRISDRDTTNPANVDLYKVQFAPHHHLHTRVKRSGTLKKGVFSIRDVSSLSLLYLSSGDLDGRVQFFQLAIRVDLTKKQFRRDFLSVSLCFFLSTS